MIIVKPVPVTMANLYSSTVAEISSGTTDYDGAVTYALGDRVTQKARIGTVTMAVSAPGIVTYTGHELTADTYIAFTTTGALLQGVTASIVYQIHTVLSANTFTIKLPNTSVEIIFTGSQSGTHTLTGHIQKTYVSLQGSNLAKNPSRSSGIGWWLEEGATDRFKMFDGSVTSQTKSSSVSVVITTQIADYIDAVALLNIEGTSVRVRVFDAGTGTFIYDVTTSLILSGITPQETANDFVVTGITKAAANNSYIWIDVTDANVNKICSVGACLLGAAVDAGGTEYGASIGIQDYSVIEQNDFGDYNIVERAFSKTASYQVMVANSAVARIFRILSERRALKTLFIGSSSYALTAIYGFPSDWTMVIQYPNYSILNIDLKGLT